jgi:HK97 family phage major capsid protein
MATEVTKILDRIGSMENAIAELAKPNYRDGAHPRDVFGDNRVPAIRKGESVLSSRPFRLINMIGLASKMISPERAKVEVAALNGFRKSLEKTGTALNGWGDESIGYPFAFSHLPDELVATPEVQMLRQSMAAGAAESIDYDEMEWIARKSYRPSRIKAAQSYLDDSIGGALVAPPTQGDLIPLIRNKSALDRAGVSNVPLPPQGKAVYPKQTSPSIAYWVGENTSIPESQIKTGQMSLMAKKLAVLFLIPNDLFKFATAAGDALFRQDAATSIALGMDYSGLYGAGGAGQPQGLINYTGTGELIDYAGLTPTPKGVGANGNRLQPEDGYLMAGEVEDRNFDPDGFKWIMRPKMWSSIASFRADAVAAGDKSGPFVQDLTRALAASLGSNWCGYEVIRSSQVRNDQTKGSGTGLSEIFGGVWSSLIMATYGAIEFTTSPGDTAFRNDQTIVKGIMYGDMGYRYPGAFVWYKQLTRS